MRLLADQNFPSQAVDKLRNLGHDVAWIQEDSPGLPDEEVLDHAARESRLLLTLDKDFGALAFQSGLPAECGILLFRVLPVPAQVAELAERVIQAEADLQGNFTVVEAARVRQRPLPMTTRYGSKFSYR